MKVDPILGLFRFDMYGKTAFLYCLAVLFVGWWVVRRIIYSPFGAMLTGIRENAARMHAIGAPVYWRLVLIYTISATMAGVAGALLTQVNQFVGLNVLGLEPSGDVLVMLILGGVGRLYGAFIGPVVYLIAQDYLAKQYPGILVPRHRHPAHLRRAVRARRHPRHPGQMASFSKQESSVRASAR